MKSSVYANRVRGPCMSQNGSPSVNSVRQAWLTVTSAKEALSRRSGQTRPSPPKSQHNSILSEEVTLSSCCYKVYMNQSFQNKTISIDWLDKILFGMSGKSLRPH